MKKCFLIASVLLLQSCCVYHETKTVGNKKTSEFGIAKYDDRPISQGVKK